jgi:hypothetical protein
MLLNGEEMQVFRDFLDNTYILVNYNSDDLNKLIELIDHHCFIIKKNENRYFLGIANNTNDYLKYIDI